MEMSTGENAVNKIVGFDKHSSTVTDTEPMVVCVCVGGGNLNFLVLK